MSALQLHHDVDPADATIIELDGPPTAYFELPLEYWATPNGELEAADHPEASRLWQRITYRTFRVADNPRVQTILERVKSRLQELGGGYIWWRRRPTHTDDGDLLLRLTTTPELPAAWWKALDRDVENRANG